MERRIKITPLQVKVFAQLERQVQFAQAQLSALATGILTGYGVESAVNVRLENDELVMLIVPELPDEHVPAKV